MKHKFVDAICFCIRAIIHSNKSLISLMGSSGGLRHIASAYGELRQFFEANEIAKQKDIEARKAKNQALELKSKYLEDKE